MKQLTLCLFACLQLAAVYSQNCPSNLDFEKGDLSNWQCSIGTTFSDTGKNFISLTDTNPIAGRHEIISARSAEQKDPYGNFPTLCPYGGNYSVKLGNNNTNAEAEGISYTFRIPADVDTLTFTYFYAVVFEDPQHDIADQPRFFVTAYDVLTGDVINCASYDYIATSSLPGFTPSAGNPGVLYKNWSPVSLQFAGLNDRLVRLEFKTADCTQGGHFGYAYLDVGTNCSNILATAPYCIETNSLILNAPYGFKDYTWYNEDYSEVVGTGQTITFSPPPAVKGTFYVDMVPYPGFGCRDTASATVLPLPVPPKPVVDPELVLCQFASSQPLTAASLEGHELFWYTSPEGGIPLSATPVPSTMAIDTMEYYVSQKKLFGCESFRSKLTVIIRPTPISSFNANSISQCEKGNDFQFTFTSTNLSNSKTFWDFGDNSTDSSGDKLVKHSYRTHGQFVVRLKTLNQPACSDEASITITVVPAPVAAFSHPEVICEKETSVSLTDRSYAVDNIGTINQWSWDIGGSPVNTQHVSSLILSKPGPLTVKLSVSTLEGCRSDTMTKMLAVRHQPAASFQFAAALCENETINLRDMSSIPPEASQEFINQWSWEYNGQAGSTVQHPAQRFTAGVYKVRLSCKSNFGCSSIPVASTIVVHQKPSVALTMTDSCVFRPISYDAEDRNGSVKNWYWNFGSGFRRGSSSVVKSFRREGDQPFILISETNEGCKDTIIRPFRIYDNKSMAGRDTTVARNQPVQLNAGGGKNVTYTWSPADGLNDSHDEKPVAILDRDQQYTLYSITDKGCESRSSILIKRYKGPDIYIPNAFTPNNDGTNDKLKVVPIGIRSFAFLAVYNRFGQLVYYSTDIHKGWDGSFNGRQQEKGNYVAVSKAVDYSGKVMIRKENVLLLR